MQASEQKPGCGFQEMIVVGLFFQLASGAMLERATGPAPTHAQRRSGPGACPGSPPRPGGWNGKSQFNVPKHECGRVPGPTRDLGRAGHCTLQVPVTLEVRRGFEREIPGSLAPQLGPLQGRYAPAPEHIVRLTAVPVGQLPSARAGLSCDLRTEYRVEHHHPHTRTDRFKAPSGTGRHFHQVSRHLRHHSRGLFQSGFDSFFSSGRFPSWEVSFPTADPVSSAVREPADSFSAIQGTFPGFGWIRGCEVRGRR